MSTPTERIDKALEIARQYAAGNDGADHKMWVIDQMVRALTDCPMETQSALDYRGQPYTFEAQGESDAYCAWVAAAKNGEDGPETYAWDEGIAP